MPTVFNNFQTEMYLSNDGNKVIVREYGVHPESKMPMNGKWVMRNIRTGEFIDSDVYFNDLVERTGALIRN